LEVLILEIDQYHSLHLAFTFAQNRRGWDSMCTNCTEKVFYQG